MARLDWMEDITKGVPEARGPMGRKTAARAPATFRLLRAALGALAFL
jgi:hypothetical protein